MLVSVVVVFADVVLFDVETVVVVVMVVVTLEVLGTIISSMLNCGSTLTRIWSASTTMASASISAN